MKTLTHNTERMKPKVVHCKKAPAGSFVYVGRPSVWGNPFSHLPGTKALYQVSTREQAISEYRRWIIEGEGQFLLKRLHELHGRDLGCWCAPQACHADVLLELANAELTEQMP